MSVKMYNQTFSILKLCITTVQQTLHMKYMIPLLNPPNKKEKQQQQQQQKPRQICWLITSIRLLSKQYPLTLGFSADYPTTAIHINDTPGLQIKGQEL